jgi:hypothetical protein
MNDNDQGKMLKNTSSNSDNIISEDVDVNSNNLNSLTSERSKNEFLIALDRLHTDPSLTQMHCNNSSLIIQKDENWTMLMEALRGNDRLLSLELANVSMKDI